MFGRTDFSKVVPLMERWRVSIEVSIFPFVPFLERWRVFAVTGDTITVLLCSNYGTLAACVNAFLISYFIVFFVPYFDLFSSILVMT